MNLEKILKVNATIALTILMISIMIFGMSIQATNAQVLSQGGAPAGSPNGAVPLPSGVSPDYTVSPNAYLSVSPNPVGVGQYVLVNFWVDPGPSYARYFPN